MNDNLSRRQFIHSSLGAGIALAFLKDFPELLKGVPVAMRFGLVTYQWGRDWDLETLLKNCETAGYMGVELRTEHAHKVEINLTAIQRAEVKKRFADSSVISIGYGSNFEFHSPDAEKLRWNIDQSREYIKLCNDIGATGLKVKPNFMPPEVPREKTITQIAASLNEIGKYARDFGQIIRVEVHGEITQEIPNMRAIFEQVTEDNVKMCWNCNDQDLLPPGLEANFNTVSKYFGDTVHIRELNEGTYPYQQLFDLLTGIKYSGWVLLEARTEPADRVAAMIEQRELFNRMAGK
ncbi:MAG: sugar phosphate isomerase/epimerase family protein [Bacteroidota bacterium]